jgi:transcription elongation factor GreA
MNQLEKEIELIRYELSVTIPEELRNATFSGDILESSEYSEILSRQYLLNVRLLQLSRRLYQNTEVNINSISRTEIGMGSLVELLCKKTNTIRKIKLISNEMSDGNVSYEEVTINSPVGKAINNKQVNDDVIVQTPSGIFYYKILSFTTIHNLKI